MDQADVVVVGGGIAGASLAYALANAGKDVAVLEASVEFEDRVRGEQMHAWGVKEARDLGVEQILLDRGAHVAGLWRQYVEGAPGPADVPVSIMVPGVDGTLNMRHPDACQALIDAAGGAGARVERGIQEIKIGREAVTAVSFRQQGQPGQVRTPLVVGADGRASTVRRQAGIELNRDEARNYITGLLLDDLDVPDDHDAMVAEGDLFFVLFHQGHGRARAYLAGGRSGQHRFSGRHATERFLEAVPLRTFPWGTALRPAPRPGRVRPIPATTPGPIDPLPTA